MSERILADEERFDWLRLIRSENIGPALFDQLLEKFGNAGAALAALPELSRKGGLDRPIRIYSPAQAEAEIARAEAQGARFVGKCEPDYPPLLRHIDSAPPVISIIGNAELARREAVAIVGSRNASANGRRLARMFAAELAEAGYAIVSGLARGIDTAAHEASLPQGTIAVIANGLDVSYPPENAGLQQAIGRDGLVLTEMPPGAQPRDTSFPRRNRIISGISRAVIVVEAALRSGSLITARFANEQGREVFAVPGSPLDPRSEGTNRLIKDGAYLLTRSQEVLDALLPMHRGFRQEEPEGPSMKAPDMTEIDHKARQDIIALLSPAPTEIDDVIRESGLSAQVVLGTLLELELAGKLVRHGRQLVSLIQA
ncbi:MAG: DNA-processing protein DprA [Parvibaculaceae bacterium]